LAISIPSWSAPGEGFAVSRLSSISNETLLEGFFPGKTYELFQPGTACTHHK